MSARLLLTLALAAGAMFAALAPAAALTDMQAASIYALAYGQYGGALPEHSPEIHVVPTARLRELAHCERCPVQGLQVGQTIYIDEALDFADAQDAAVLLHEMIHYLQWVAHGDVADCADWLDRERQAYLIQAHVLERVGADPRRVLLVARQLSCV